MLTAIRKWFYDDEKYKVADQKGLKTHAKIGRSIIAE